jgi:hypothetical protein
VAAKPKQVTQAKTMAKAGSSAKQIQNKTGVSAKRAGNLSQKATKAMPANRTFTNSAGDVVQQQADLASSPAAQQRFNSLQSQYGGSVQSQFIPGLMEPGMKGYDPSTGGGNFAFARGNIDPEALRAWYRTGSTDLAEGDRSKYTLEALNPTTNATAAAPQATAKKRGGLAGAGANVSRREALKIAQGKDISVAQVMDRALGRGQTLGASLVNKYNAGKLDDRSYIQKATDRVLGNMGGKSQYQPESLSRLNTFGKMPKGSTYGGMTSTGVPILGMKPPKNTMGATTKGSPTGGAASGGSTLGGGSAAANGSDLGNTTVADTAPTETPTNGINIDLGGNTDIFSTATGFRTKKSSRRGGGARAQGLGSQRVSPVGGWNYNLG